MRNYHLECTWILGPLGLFDRHHTQKFGLISCSRTLSGPWHLISCCRTFSVPDIQDVCFCLLYMHPVWIGVGAGIRVKKFIRYHAASAELLAVSRRGTTNKLSFHKPTGKKNTTHTHHLPRVKCTCGVAQLSRIPMNAPCLDSSRFGHRTVKSKKRGPKGHALV